MLRDHIAHALPEGVSQPLMSRLLVGGGSRGWVRAGDIRRVGSDLAFTPRWDGQGFAELWQAALDGDAEDTMPRVEFAVRMDGGLVLLADARLDLGLRLSAGRAQREAQRERRRWSGRGR